MGQGYSGTDILYDSKFKNTFPTVAAMVAHGSAKVGDLVQCTRYHSDTDSGVLTFVAVNLGTGVADGGTYINGAGIQWKQIFPSDNIPVENYGTGMGDQLDHVKIQAAIDYAYNIGGAFKSFLGGGVVSINSWIQLYGIINVKSGVSLVGQSVSPGGWKAIGQGSVIFSYNNISPIQLRDNATISGLWIHNYNNTYPQSETQAKNWQGTAITAFGSGITVQNCYITGYALAYTNGTENGAACARNKLYNLYIDCNAGTSITRSVDVDYLDTVHIWPFLSDSTGQSQRSGVGIYFHGDSVGNWPRLNNCFVFGHETGFKFHNSWWPTLVNCGVDGNNLGIHNPAIPWTGFSFTGECKWAKMTSCDVGGDYSTGIDVNITKTVNDNVNSLQIANSMFGSGAAVKHIGVSNVGQLMISNCNIVSGTDGILIAADCGAVIKVTGTSFSNQTGRPIKNVATNYSTNHIIWSGNSITGNAAASPHWHNGFDQKKSKSSEVNLVLEHDWSVFHLTGPTNISAFYGSLPGRVVTIKCVTTGFSITPGGSSIVLKEGLTTITLLAGDTVNFHCTGTVWYQM